MPWVMRIALLGVFFAQAGLALVALAGQTVYYDPTIREIVNRDCARCHSGPLRNLMSYEALKAYAESGMLAAMLQGLMRQFAGADQPTILAWVQAGAPRSPASASTQAGAQTAAFSTSQQIYFEPTIRNIIVRDCGRCHSGRTRNLTDWDHIRMYVENGMLSAMLQGPMQRFAGPDAELILAWINAGAPENPPKTQPATAAPRITTAAVVCPTPGQGPHAGAPLAQQQAPITYTNTIEGLLAKDCMTCHLGPFRPMTNYKQVKMYVDNGLLETLVSPGGPMHRFAGPDTRYFLAWIRAGAPK